MSEANRHAGPTRGLEAPLACRFNESGVIKGGDALEHASAFDTAVAIDGDLNHAAERAPLLIARWVPGRQIAFDLDGRLHIRAETRVNPIAGCAVEGDFSRIRSAGYRFGGQPLERQFPEFLGDQAQVCELAD